MKAVRSFGIRHTVESSVSSVNHYRLLDGLDEVGVPSASVTQPVSHKPALKNMYFGRLEFALGSACAVMCMAREDRSGRAKQGD